MERTAEKQNERAAVTNLIENMVQSKFIHEDLHGRYLSNLQTTLIAKLPKLVLLTKIVPFMEEDDMFRFSRACKVLYRLFYSPMGLKLVLNSRTQTMAEYFRDQLTSKTNYYVINKNPNTDFYGNFRKDFEKIENYPLENYVQVQTEDELNTLKNIKKFLTNKLIQNQTTIESIQNQIILINELLQKEKKLKVEYKAKRIDYEEIRETDAETVRELEQKYTTIIEAKQKIAEEFSQDNAKLKAAKVELEKEIVALNKEYTTRHEQKEQYYEALRKIKNIYYQTQEAIECLERLEVKTADTASSS